MDQKLFDILLGVTIWVGLADGEFAHVEKATCFKRLSAEFPEVENLEEILEKSLKKFHKNYKKEAENLIKNINNYENILFNKDKILKFAQLVLIDDQNISPNEELVLKQLEEVLHKS